MLFDGVWIVVYIAIDVYNLYVFDDYSAMRRRAKGSVGLWLNDIVLVGARSLHGNGNIVRQFPEAGFEFRTAFWPVTHIEHVIQLRFAGGGDDDDVAVAREDDGPGISSRGLKLLLNTSG